MWPFTRRAPVAVETRHRESASSDRERWFRDADGVRAPGTGTRGLTDGQRMRAVKKSRVEYDKAAVYGGVLDRFIDFVMGDGIVIKAKDEIVDTWLQEQLKHGWYGREREIVENLFIDGENMLTVRALARGDTGAPIGEVRIGQMDPLDVGDVLLNRYDLAEIISLKVARQSGTPIPLRLLRPGEPAQATIDTETIGERTVTHHVLGSLWRVNARGGRGVPVLLRTLDHASDLDNLIALLVAQMEYVRRLWMVAWLDMPDDSNLGKDSKFLAAKQKLLKWASSMEPGELAVFAGKKDAAVIESFAQKFEMADARALYDVVLEMCLGGHGIPKMWFGGGGDTNRSVAAEQGTPIFRAIQSRQSEVKACVESLVRAVLAMGEASGVAGVTAGSAFDVTMATVATRDSERDVREIAALAASLAVAVERKALTEQEAADILRAAIQSKTFGAKLKGPAPVVAPKPAISLVPPPPPGAAPEKPPVPAAA